MHPIRRVVLLAASAVAVGAALSCGGGSSGGGSTTTPTTPTPTPGGNLPTAVTITIGTTGQVDPVNVTIAAGGRVTFVNNHNQPHDMASDPHPEHTDCPELNQVGFLTAGQSRTSGNLNAPRRCGFHDHNNPTDRRYQGVITVQ